MSSLVDGAEIPARSRSSTAMVAWFLMLALALLGCGATYVGYVLWPRWPAIPTDAPAVPVTVSGVLLNVPPAAIRVPVQRRGGEQERLDLAFLWPTLAPPPPSKSGSEDAADAQERLFVTVVGAGAMLSAHERLQTIYPRYLVDGANMLPNGLSVQAFANGTPYQGEDLFMEAGRPDKFLVRCSRNSASGAPGMCLYERRVGAVDITVRFPRELLTDWRDVQERSERLIASLRSPPR